MICQICSSVSASWCLVLPACCHFVTTDARVHPLSIPFLAKMKLSNVAQARRGPYGSRLRATDVARRAPRGENFLAIWIDDLALPGAT